MRRFLLAVAVVLIATCAQAQGPDAETVTIHAEGVPIGTLLAELAQRHRFEKITIQAEVQQHPVWIALDEVPLRTALQRILEASGLDFAVSGRRVIVGDWTTMATARLDDVSAGQRAADAQAVHEAERRAAEAAAEEQAISAEFDNESTILPAMPVRFVANGENITYLEPNFVPFKMRPEVRALRMAIDVAKIP